MRWRCLLPVLAVLVSARVVIATGWNDYVQPIGDGYRIFRATTVVLTHDNGVTVGDENDPVVAFAVTPTFIFAKTEPLGGTPSFYVVKKSSATVVGPLAVAAFTSDPDVVNAGKLNWQVPTNPNPEVARDGQLMFLGFMALLFGVPTLVFVAGVVLIVWWFRRKRRHAVAARGFEVA